MENDVKLVFIGEKDMLSQEIRTKIHSLEEKSKNNKSLVLCVALSYGSRHEIVNAVKEISKDVMLNKVAIDDISIDLISNKLYTRDIPDPDILIRTSGEQRISNYLLWQLAYSELFFTNTLWPDFEKEELMDIIQQFNNRERRYGKN